MSTESQEPQGPNVDQVLADIESRGDTAWRLEFARLASAMDVYLTQVHMLLNDERIYDGSADWPVMNTIAGRVVNVMIAAALTGRDMSSFLAANKPTEGS